jgi:hypothetical protein
VSPRTDVPHSNKIDLGGLLPHVIEVDSGRRWVGTREGSILSCLRKRFLNAFTLGTLTLSCLAISRIDKPSAEANVSRTLGLAEALKYLLPMGLVVHRDFLGCTGF